MLVLKNRWSFVDLPILVDHSLQEELFPFGRYFLSYRRFSIKLEGGWAKTFDSPFSTLSCLVHCPKMQKGQYESNPIQLFPPLPRSHPYRLGLCCRSALYCGVQKMQTISLLFYFFLFTFIFNEGTFLKNAKILFSFLWLFHRLYRSRMLRIWLNVVLHQIFLKL